MTQPRLIVVAGANGAGKSTLTLRLALRAGQGGHDVPDEDIRRRLERSRANFAAAARLADRTMVYDNSDKTLEWVASLESGRVRMARPAGWWTPLLKELEN